MSAGEIPRRVRRGLEKVQRARIEDLQAIFAELREFWGDRDTLGLHQALFVHELGDTALLIRDVDGRAAAYLLGFLTPADVGYIHLVAVRADRRGRGLARLLYTEFEAHVHARGGVALKAITAPGNVPSHAFHRALGFSATEVPGYSATGEPRTVFRRELG